MSFVALALATNNAIELARQCRSRAEQLRDAGDEAAAQLAYCDAMEAGVALAQALAAQSAQIKAEAERLTEWSVFFSTGLGEVECEAA